MRSSLKKLIDNGEMRMEPFTGCEDCGAPETWWLEIATDKFAPVILWYPNCVAILVEGDPAFAQGMTPLSGPDKTGHYICMAHPNPTTDVFVTEGEVKWILAGRPPPLWGVIYETGEIPPKSE